MALPLPMTKRHYAPTSKMADLLSDHYNVFLLVFNLGMRLGVGDKTVAEVCKEQKIDLDSFLALVHFLLGDDGKTSAATIAALDLDLLIRFLKSSHVYFLDYRLPQIGAKMDETLREAPKEVKVVMKRFFDEYSVEVHRHMDYENDVVFPYVEGLLRGDPGKGYSIAIFEKKHDQVELKMLELKNILIKYYKGEFNPGLNNLLHELYACGSELKSHNAIEDELFIPAIEALEEDLKGQKGADYEG